MIRVAAAFRGVTVAPMPAGHSLAPLADIPDGQRRDGGPELVIRRKHPVIAMPVLPRRRDEIGEPVEDLKGRELDDAIGPRPRGLAATPGPDPVGGFVSGQYIADAGDPAEPRPIVSTIGCSQESPSCSMNAAVQPGGNRRSATVRAGRPPADVPS